MNKIILILSSTILIMSAYIASAEISYDEARKLANDYGVKISPEKKITASMIQTISTKMQKQRPNHDFFILDQILRTRKASKSEILSLETRGAKINLSNRGWIKSIQFCNSMDEFKNELNTVARFSFGIEEFNPIQLFEFLLDFNIAHQNSMSPNNFRYIRSDDKMCVDAYY